MTLMPNRPSCCVRNCILHDMHVCHRPISAGCKTAVNTRPLTDSRRTVEKFSKNRVWDKVREGRTTWVSWQQKGKPFWILMKQEMMGWQCHQLDHMQTICTWLQTENHASTSPPSFYRPDALPATQPTASKR